MAKAIMKRVRISKMNKHIMLAVLATSLVAGVSIVFTVYFVKSINFNSLILEAKEKAAKDYDNAITAVGICKDLNGDSSYSNEELDVCDPNALDVTTLTGTLRNEVMVDMANNMDLESVARLSLSECYEDGKKINFTERYRRSSTDEERTENFNLLKRCSALRVIPDALPSQRNEEALLASLNAIFDISNWKPDSLAPGSAVGGSNIKGLSTIPVSLSVSADVETTTRVLANIERSIREFDINTAVVRWIGDDKNADVASKLELNAQADAYYANEQEILTEKYVVRADKGIRRSSS